MSNAGTHARRNYYMTPSKHTRRNCTTYSTLRYAETYFTLSTSLTQAFVTGRLNTASSVKYFPMETSYATRSQTSRLYTRWTWNWLQKIFRKCKPK